MLFMQYYIGPNFLHIKIIRPKDYFSNCSRIALTKAVEFKLDYSYDCSLSNSQIKFKHIDYTGQQDFSCMGFFNGVWIIWGALNPNLVLVFVDHILFVRYEKKLF